MDSRIVADKRLVSYSKLARLLHWLVAAMIVLQFVLAKLADRADDADQTLRQLGLLANHKSVGITVLSLALLRLIWRGLNPPPALPQTMPKWQVRASHLSHWSFYLLLFALPISGWLMSSASAYSVSWFNLLQLPDLVAPSPDLKHTLEEIHEVLAKLLFVLAVVHIVAAVKHLLVDKDDIMQRMASKSGGLIFVAVIIIGVATLGQAGQRQVDQSQVGQSREGADTPASSTDTSHQTAPDEIAGATTAEHGSSASLSFDLATGPAPGESALPIWDIDYGASYIRFTADQAGADFTGEWRQWNAQLQFSSDRLAESWFDVTIDTRMVDTQDAERDAALAEADWFDTANFATAYYRAHHFTASANGSFIATGELTLKGQAFPVDLQFTVTENDGRRALSGTGVAVLLDGSAELDRLKLRIGTGEWADTGWVGQTVRVNVRVEAQTTPDHDDSH